MENGPNGPIPNGPPNTTFTIRQTENYWAFCFSMEAGTGAFLTANNLNIASPISAGIMEIGMKRRIASQPPIIISTTIGRTRK